MRTVEESRRERDRILYEQRQGHCKIKGTKDQLAILLRALFEYKIATNNFPSTEQGLQALVDSGILPRMPKDKWGFDFSYNRERIRSIAIMSMGADNKPGGEGPNADLVDEFPNL